MKVGAKQVVDAVGAFWWVSSLAGAAILIAWMVLGISSPRGSILCSAACGPAGMKSYTVRSNGWHDDTPVCVCNPPAARALDGGAP